MPTVEIEQEEYDRLKGLDAEVVELREFEPTAEWLSNEHPEVHDGVYASGVEAERARILGIRDAALPGQEKLVDELIAEGTALAEAKAKLLADPKMREEVKRLRALAAYKDAAPPSAGAGEEETAEATGEEAWTKEFQADANLQKEFGGDLKRYLAYRRNEDRVRVPKKQA